jgi:pectate lyase
MSNRPRRPMCGPVFPLLMLAAAGWACATSDAIEPDPTGTAGTGDTGGAGTTGSGGTTGDAGTNGTAGTTGAAGAASTAGTTGNAGRGGSFGSTGAAGSTAGRGGTTGAAGSTAGRGGTTGAAGSTAGRGGTTGTAGRGGSVGSAGAAGSSAGRGGTTGAGGSTGSGGGASSTLCTWPTAASSQAVSATINVSGSYDGGMKRFMGSGPLGGSGQGEGQGPIFEIANGGTLTNAILGNPAADGIHCNGTCTLRNVWWEDVGEDAATLRGSSSSQTMTIDTGGAKGATDKIFQHNGPGTMIIRNFCAQDFGKMYRSCGNCSSQYARHLEMDNVMIIPRAGPLAGINTNYNDTAKFTRITVRGATNSIRICERYTGNNTGAEPVRTGDGPDGTYCMYSASDITWMP